MIALVLACILILLAGGLALAAVILEVPLHRGPVPTPRSVASLLESERRFAAALGWSWPHWVVIRGLVLTVALVAAVAMRVPAVIVLAMALGLVGPRLLLGSRAEHRRIRQARSFIGLLRQFASRLAVTNEPFDAILADVARTAPPELGFLVAAAASPDVLGAVRRAIRNAKSPLLERGLVTLLVSRTRDRLVLSDLLVRHEIPQLEGEIEEAEEIRAMRASQNATIAILAGALTFMFAFLNSVPTLHDFYSSAEGSVALLVVVCVFVLSVSLMKLMLRQPRPLHWDVERVARDVGRLGGG